MENLLSITATSMSGNSCQIKIDKSSTGKDLKKCIENATNAPDTKASVMKLHNDASEIKDTDKLDQIENGATINYTLLPGCTMTFRLPKNMQIDESDSLEVMVATTSNTYKDVIYALSFYIDFTPLISKDGVTCESSARLGTLDASHTYAYDLVDASRIPCFFNGELFVIEKNVNFGTLLKEFVPNATADTRLALEGSSRPLSAEGTPESAGIQPWSRIISVEKGRCLLL